MYGMWTNTHTERLSSVVCPCFMDQAVTSSLLGKMARPKYGKVRICMSVLQCVCGLCTVCVQDYLQFVSRTVYSVCLYL